MPGGLLRRLPRPPITLARAQPQIARTRRHHGYSENQDHCTEPGSLLTAGEPGAPVDVAWAQEHHNF